MASQVDIAKPEAMLGLFGARGFIDPRLRLITTARGRSVVTAGSLPLGQTRWASCAVVFEVRQGYFCMLGHKVQWQTVG